MKLMMADKAKLSALGPTKAPAPSWQNRQVRNPITGALENETFNANAPNAQLRAEVPMEQVKYGNEVIDVPAKAAGVIKAYRMAGIEKDKQFERDQADKAKTQKIKYLENAMEEDKALGKAGQESYTLHMQQLAELVGLSTAGIARDPEVDKARAMIMEAIQDIKMYDKASQDQEDKGAPLAPTSMPQMPPRQFMIPPPKKEPKGPKEPTFTEERMSAKDAAKAEEAIVNPDNEGNPALVGPMSIFNRFSSKPYVYIWKTEKKKKGIIGFRKEVDVGVTKKIDLPIVNGKQVTAKEVWFTAQENGITMEEVLKLIGAIE